MIDKTAQRRGEAVLPFLRQIPLSWKDSEEQLQEILFDHPDNQEGMHSLRHRLDHALKDWKAEVWALPHTGKTKTMYRWHQEQPMSVRDWSDLESEDRQERRLYVEIDISDSKDTDGKAGRGPTTSVDALMNASADQQDEDGDVGFGDLVDPTKYN